MKFFEIYERLCASKGESANSAAKNLKIASGTVSEWKQGRVPRNTTLKKIADYFDVSVDYLLGQTDIKKLPPEVHPFSMSDTFQLEILGSIRAGYDGALVEERSGEHFPVPNEVMKGRRLEDLFALRVKGDSMYPTLLDGDVVILERAPSVTSGSMAAIIYNGE